MDCIFVISLIVISLSLLFFFHLEKLQGFFLNCYYGKYSRRSESWISLLMEHCYKASSSLKYLERRELVLSF